MNANTVMMFHTVMPFSRTRAAIASLFGAAALLGAVVLLAGAPAAQTSPRVVDLGHPLSATDPSWDGQPAFERTVVDTFDRAGYTTGKIEVDEHFGTHLDAPAHFAKDGWTVDQIPAERLYRPGVCIDVTARAALNPDYRVTRADITAFEVAHGRVPAGAVVLIATGWDRYWAERIGDIRWG